MLFRSEPEWYPPKVARLFALVEEALAPLYGPSQATERSNAARMLWASFHGMCALEAKGALAMSATTLVDLLIEHFLGSTPASPSKGRRTPASH